MKIRKFEHVNELPSEFMYIIPAPCWKCNNPMKIALIRGNDYEKRGSTTCGPESFSPVEINLAQSKGVLIKEQYSGTMDNSYLANTCPSCDSFVGSFYLFTDYFRPAEDGKYPCECIEIN